MMSRNHKLREEMKSSLLAMSCTMAEAYDGHTEAAKQVLNGKESVTFSSSDLSLQNFHKDSCCLLLLCFIYMYITVHIMY